MNVDELYRMSRRAAGWGVGLSLFLGLVKLVAGWFGDSFALVSDAVHSLGDAVTLGALWGALVLSQRPPDPEHPYGHTRAETVAGSSVAVLLILSALWIGGQAVATLHQSYTEPELYTFWVAALSAAVKEGLYRYNVAVARQAGSSALSASAWDHRLDALNSVAVMAGVGLARWAGWHAADHVAALIVAVTILVVGVRLFLTSLDELMDRQAEPELQAQVRREAAATPGVVAVEKLFIRKTGLEYLVDIHVEVDPQLTVRDGHAIAHAVKDRLVQHDPRIKDVLVHVEPAGPPIAAD